MLRVYWLCTYIDVDEFRASFIFKILSQSENVVDARTSVRIVEFVIKVGSWGVLDWDLNLGLSLSGQFQSHECLLY